MKRLPFDRSTIWGWVALVLLVVIGVFQYSTSRRPFGAAKYHQQVREATEQVPDRIEGWVGHDAPVPAQAVDLLKPNVILSRKYMNVENGVSANVLLVHCTDTHDILGHYPPRCFAGQGWEQVQAEARDWTVGGVKLTGTEYEYVRSSGTLGSPAQSAVAIANCILRPGGRVLRDMNGLSETAADGALGAGQIQVYLDASLTRQERDEAVTALLTGYRPVLDAVLSEVPR